MDLHKQLTAYLTSLRSSDAKQLQTRFRATTVLAQHFSGCSAITSLLVSPFPLLRPTVHTMVIYPSGDQIIRKWDLHYYNKSSNRTTEKALIKSWRFVLLPSLPTHLSSQKNNNGGISFTKHQYSKSVSHDKSYSHNITKVKSWQKLALAILLPGQVMTRGPSSYLLALARGDCMRVPYEEHRFDGSVNNNQVWTKKSEVQPRRRELWKPKCQTDLMVLFVLCTLYRVPVVDTRPYLTSTYVELAAYNNLLSRNKGVSVI